MHQSSKIGFWRGLGVAAMLARRDVKNRYASSYAGVAWNIGVPLVFALVNVVVFSVLLSGRMGARYSDVPFSLFYFVPYSLWILFFEVVGRSSGVLREYSYLINKISFPVWVLPLVPLASAFLSQLVIFLIVTVLLFTNGLAPDGGLLAFVLLWALTIVLAIGVSYLVSSISVYCRIGAVGTDPAHHHFLVDPDPVSRVNRRGAGARLGEGAHHDVQPLLLPG